ncbi:MAG: MerR family transcriptional regulator [Desulfuromonas sp.]|nr:MAG: MerR family transcriptional regulator [Desulfuromonas sp.]
MYRISELGREFGLARSTLLYYDRVGLLVPSARSAAGYRLYNSEDRERLEAICSFRQAGLGVEAICAILDSAGDDVGRVLQRRLQEIGREIRELQNQQRVLAGLVKLQGAEGSVAGLDKELFVSVLRATGLDEAAMHQFHQEFERHDPQAHQAFLLALGIPEIEAQRIRRLAQEAS